MKPFIVMQTDFGKGIAVSTMEGVILNIDSSLRIFDAVHDIPAFNTYAASISLAYYVTYWKPKTIFISVVDPGVGTDRKAVVAKLSNGSYVVTPDNGSLTHLKRHFGIEEVRIIDETKNRLETTKEVSIFHGRDLFAYCAGKLASGIIDFEGVGPAYSVDEIIEHEAIEPTIQDGMICGMIESASEKFGLIDTNIPFEMFEKENIVYGDNVETTIYHKDKKVCTLNTPFHPSFGYVKPLETLVMVSETKHMQIARNLGNLTTDFNLSNGPDWKITYKKI